jgi:hypothetical protein
VAAASGLEYTGENRSSLYTPVTQTQGGIGQQVFAFGGNPNLAFTAQGVAPTVAGIPKAWLIGGGILAAIVLAVVLIK